MKILVCFICFSLSLTLFLGCSYRFVDPFPASEYTLVSIRNATSEAGLAFVLEDELRLKGGFRKGNLNRLSVAITSFSEEVESVGSSGIPIREKITMAYAWKVENTGSGRTTFGNNRVQRSYPYSNDLPTLDWNRTAAIRLLADAAARNILDNLGARP